MGQSVSSNLSATEGDFRRYFGLPVANTTPDAFLDWAAAVASGIVKELPRTSLDRKEQATLRRGLDLALMLLGQHKRRAA